MGHGTPSSTGVASGSISPDVQPVVELGGLLAGGLGRHVHERADLVVARGDAREGVLGDLGRRELAARDERRGLERGQGLHGATVAAAGGEVAGRAGCVDGQLSWRADVAEGQIGARVRLTWPGVSG